MTALRREEAEARARALYIDLYTVHLDLTRGHRTFGSRTSIEFRAREDVETFLEIDPVSLESLALDGTELDTSLLAGNRFPLTLPAGPHRLDIAATMPFSDSGEGLHLYTDPVDDRTYVYTMSFLDNAQKIFACFDQPDLKAAFDLTADLPETWKGLANGVPSITNGSTFGFATTPRISPYLFAFAAGPWHSVTAEHAGLPFGLHCRRSLAEHLDAEDLFAHTFDCYDGYAELFDEPYPFDSYDQVFAPDFNHGAMENPGMVVFRESMVFRDEPTESERRARNITVAHEMAHMWFGDLVTMRWWDDLWLNESFADFISYRLNDDWTDFTVKRVPWGTDSDQYRSTHPVVPPSVEDSARAFANFDGISYAKGATCLRQLSTRLGEEAFFAGVNAHLTRHRFANATLEDFLRSLDEHTDQDVRAWAGEWLRTTGVDTVSVRKSASSETSEIVSEKDHRLAIAHFVPSPDSRPSDGRTPLVLERSDDVGTRDLEGGHHRWKPLVLPDHKCQTYAKIRPDGDSLRLAKERLSDVDDGLSRAVLWRIFRDLVRDGEFSPRDYISMAAAHLPGEDPIVAESVLANARRVVADLYLRGSDREEALDALASVSRSLLEDKNLYLPALRTLIDCSTDSFPSVPADNHDLAWRVLLRRCVLGQAAPRDIDERERADFSKSGTEWAAKCRAALPDPAAKEAAWKTMFHSGATPYLVAAVGQGFWQPEQRELVSGFEERWLDEASNVKGTAMAMTLARQAFPLNTAGKSMVDRTGAWLARPDLNPSLRRGVSDKLDELERAVAVRGGESRGTDSSGSATPR
ncbi:aminopeptidase N [Salininema proteolyticum]|uniref:Aminopeptidase N n=1 Tax=Salininema proteolyticum TaxID=1607685 RepID=A0ABV8TUP2_9ACTN